MNANVKFTQVILLIVMFGFGTLINAQETVIKQAELPKTAQTFLSQNFSGQKAIQIIKDKGMISTEYEIRMENGTKVEFDGDGNWKEVDGKNKSAIPTGFIPSNITSYVSKNFPTYQISKIEKESKKYEVELTNGLDLEFNLNGDFLRIDD